MEVISGMAPRPSTPQPYQQTQAHTRSMSAPNSPARLSFPGINRLPSQDSLDRSIHNESGHGKSTAQIIRDLKSANASLSAKSASMEAQFMNQMSSVTKKMEERQRQSDEQLKQYKKQLANLEAHKTASDSKLKEKDAQLSKVKEESAFQRHTISDLKNQLYQLQNDLEEREMDKRDDFDQLLADNQEMARQLAVLQQKNNEYEDALASKEQDQYYRRQLQESQGELESHRQRLSMTQTNLNVAQRERETLEEEHAQRIQKLEVDLEDQAEQWREREKSLRSQIEKMEFTDSQVSEDLKIQLEEKDETIMKLQVKIDQYADKAAELAASLAQAREDAENQEQYRRDEAEDLRILHDAQEEEITKLRKELDDARNELELRDTELDEKDRELKLSTPKEEVEKLRKRLSDSESQLILKEDSLRELTVASPNQEVVAKLENELAEARDGLTMKDLEIQTLRDLQKKQEKPSEESREDPGVTKEVEEKLLEEREKISRLEKELSDQQKNHKTQVEALRSSVDALMKEKDDTKRILEELRKEKDDAVSSLEDETTEFSKLKSQWEERSEAAVEAERLRTDIDTMKLNFQQTVDAMKKKLEESTASEKVAQAKVNELQGKVEELESLSKAQESKSNEVQRLQKQVEAAQQGSSTLENGQVLDDAKKEIEELHSLLASWENGENSNRLKKQLREAQVALVALDDEKKEMSQRHRELLSAVERKKEEIQRESKELLASKDKEIETLKSKMKNLEEREAEMKALSSQLEAERKKSHSLESELNKADNELASRGEVNRTTPAIRSVPFDDAAIAVRVEQLEEEKEALRVKLKDRDTTISALVRSSVKLEQKIASMETEISSAKSVQASEHEKSDLELAELRNVVSALKAKEPQLNEDIAILKRELKLAKSDAKRFRHALQEDGTTGSEYRFRIAMLQKDLEETTVKVEERDIAIENLVNQSITQDAHVKDLKTRLSTFMKEGEKKTRYEDSGLKAEIRRLQQESEIFAGQIIEQDDELEKLKKEAETRDGQIAALKKQIHSRGTIISPRSFSEEEESAAKKELTKVQSDLRARDTQIEQLRRELETKQGGPGSNGSIQKVAELQAELDEIQEASEDNRKELRDLRRQLWNAKEAAGEANDLKLELAQAKYALDEYKRTGSSKLSSQPISDYVDRQELNQLRQQLDDALAAKKVLEQRLLLKAKASAVDPSEIKTLQWKLGNSLAKTKSLEERIGEISEQQKNEAIDNLKLRRNLDEALAEKKSLEQRMAQQSESLRRRNVDSVDKLKAEIKEKDTRISELEQGASALNEQQVSVFQNELETLRKELSEKTTALDKLRIVFREKEDDFEKSESLKLKLVRELADSKAACKNLEEQSAEKIKNIDEDVAQLSLKNKALVAQNEALTKSEQDMTMAQEELSNALEVKAVEIDRLKTELDTLSRAHEGGTSDLKSQLEQAREARETAEKTIVESYESRLAEVSRENQLQMDNLRKDLAESRGKSSQDLTEMVTRIKDLENENNAMRGQFEIEMQAKNQQIFALEHTLHAQEQTVDSMREEMDQLQGGMERATEKRRVEVEDLQQEVIQFESRSKNQEREIVALKMQLEEGKLENKAEVVRLKDIIANMEKESPLARTVAELQNDDRMLEVRERLEQLKMRNTELQEENLKLGGRLERAIIEIKSFDAEKRHAEEMEHENASLRRQVQGLEQILAGGGRPAAPAPQTPADKENNVSKAKEKTAATKQKNKNSFKGLFKRRSHGLHPDEIIKEEKEEDPTN